MKHHCPMCGEQWNDDQCFVCGWDEGKQPRYTAPKSQKKRTATKQPKGHAQATAASAAQKTS